PLPQPARLGHAPLARRPVRRRPDGRGARRLRVGCCAGLMLILFALGAMSLLWMTVVAAVVFAEKVALAGDRSRRCSRLRSRARGRSVRRMTLHAALRPPGPYSLALSARLASDASRRWDGEVLEALVPVAAGAERVRARQRADGTVEIAAATEEGVMRMRFVL